MIQPLQRNWRWFHEQREQRAFLECLQFVLAFLYLHRLKVSQFEKDLQQQRERCKLLTEELEKAKNLQNNLQRAPLQSLKTRQEDWWGGGNRICTFAGKGEGWARMTKLH